MDTNTIGKTPAAADGAPVVDMEIVARLREHLEAGALLAVSGGPDSMALLALACRCSKHFATARPQVFSFNHGLRPESASECDLVARICEGWGLRHHIVRWQPGVRPTNGLQADARFERYRCGLAIARAERLTRILTAHHRDDQAETVLMRLMRGREARSLACIHAQLGRVEDGPIVVRPFLDLSKLQLRAVAEGLGMPFVDDPSNGDRRFERARVRARISSHGADIDELSALAARMARRSSALERCVDARLHAHSRVRHGRIEGSISLLDGAGTLSRAVLRRLIMATAGSTSPPGTQALDSLAQALVRGEGSRTRRTLGGACVTRTGGQLVVEREWGRHGPADLRWSAGSSIWDGRFRISGVADCPDGDDPGDAVVRAFGHTGRGSAFERTLPTLWRGSVCVAVPQSLAAKAPEKARCDLKVESFIEKRLFDPYLGGLFDRLRLDSY